MAPILELSSISKSYGPHQVLSQISLSVEAGEFLTLLGCSGSGKTTLLRLIGGFEKTDSGQIRLSGRDITEMPPYRRRVNTVFQSYALFPQLTVSQNIAFGLQNLRLSAPQVQARVQSGLELVRLKGFEDRLPDELSGGQQQRVALARALVMEPEVLLLDEPLGALDAVLRKQMQEELKSLQRETGLTFVFVTHDQDEALRLSDRIVVLNAGQLEQVGSPEEIYERPRSRFVADFMGVENIFPVAALARDGDLWRASLQGGLSVSVRSAGSGPLNFRYFAIRPGRIKLTDRVPANGQANVVKGTIVDGHYLGAERRWSVRVAGQDRWSVVEPAREPGSSNRHLRVHDKVFLSWNSDDGLLLS
ncbi:MAG: ABC transporter ATP-binding protein [Acidobacteriota bacterium]